jgi:hypothetical protein
MSQQQYLAESPLHRANQVRFFLATDEPAVRQLAISELGWFAHASPSFEQFSRLTRSHWQANVLFFSIDRFLGETQRALRMG